MHEGSVLMYHNFYRRPFYPGNRRFFGGGFLLPFALGGLAGAALTPNYYQPTPYYYPYYY